MQTTVLFRWIGLCGAVALAGGALAQSYSALTLDPRGAVTARLPYFPTALTLTDVRPTQIHKEPAYRAKPKYGIIHLGNGPRNAYAFALDEPKDGEFKIYIDRNQNGDLTDDGDGAWTAKRTTGRVMYGVMNVTLRASYGNAKHETGSAQYTIGLYRFPDLPSLFAYRETAHRGRVMIDGKAHPVLLVENDTNALYRRDSPRPLWLQLDMKGNGQTEIVDVRSPFRLGAMAYEATVTPDGFQLLVRRTTKPVPVPKVSASAAPPPPLLKAGVPAPDFVAEKWGGGNLHLADYKGHIVVLDFWATWCGPCQASMPHIQKVSLAAAGQDVVVLGVCVWDDRQAYQAWVPKNQDKYTFQLAFDPAGRGANDIAHKMYNVSGIPTTYVIDRNGAVAEAIVGYDEGDTRLEAALKKLGVKL